MTLKAEQRRALAMLATPGHSGATQPFLIAHGFGGAMISGLVNRGFATLAREKIRAGGNIVHVTKLRITAAGRDPRRRRLSQLGIPVSKLPGRAPS
jgi:hypothetical protein